jgi:two-component system chemotaxis sensor kinase CheA
LLKNDLQPVDTVAEGATAGWWQHQEVHAALSWTNDPELERLFREELTTRSAALVEGAVRYAAREHDAGLTTEMYREGHSVKGTSRVMGFEAISIAGKLLESTWRMIDQGELEWDHEVADALLGLAESLPEAIDADPVAGTDEMSVAIADLRSALEAVGRPPSPDLAPPAPAERREALADPVPFDVEDVGDATVGHEAPSELSGSYQIGYDEEEPSTLDILRAKSLAKDEAAAPAAAVGGGDVADPLTSSVDVAEPAPSAASGYTPPSVEPSGSAGETESVDLTALPSLAAVDGSDVGGLLGAVQDWASGQTVTVNAGRLYELINGVAALRIDSEAVLHKAQSHRLATGVDAGDLVSAVNSLTSRLVDLERESLELTAVSLDNVLSTLPQLIGFISRRLDKEVRFEVTGGDTLIDRAIIDVIGDPVRQLVVNAIRHGIESPERRRAVGKPTTGLVAVDVTMLDGHVQVTVSDDGAGVDWAAVNRIALTEGLIDQPTDDTSALLPIIFTPGFSTAQQTELGGVGNGLPTVAAAIESLFGRLSIHSEGGKGTVARFTVPTSRALQRIVIIEDGGLRWGLPDAAVDQVIPLAGADVDWEAEQPMLRLRNEAVPLYAISQIVGGGRANLSEILVVSHRSGTVAFAVGKVEVVREVATKELGPLLQGPDHITGAALLGAGDVVLVLDPFELSERARLGRTVATLNGPRVLIVDDSPGVRAVVSAALSSNGFVTSTVTTAAEAADHMAGHHVDAIVVDFSMPGEDGISLVARIRAKDPLLPIVMLSGAAAVEDQKRALAAGANAYIDKSDLREGALAATLQHLVAKAKRARTGAV